MTFQTIINIAYIASMALCFFTIHKQSKCIEIYFDRIVKYMVENEKLKEKLNQYECHNTDE